MGDSVWINLSVPPIKLDIIRFSRHQLVLAAGVYNLVPDIYDCVRITLGPNSNVVVNGQSFPLFIEGSEGDGSRHSESANNDKIKISGDIIVENNKLTGVVLDFDPSHDIRSSNHESGHNNGNDPASNSAHQNNGNHDNTTVSYTMKKNYEAQQIAILGTNFPVSPPDYNMLTNVTLDKTEVCKKEEIKVDTSFVKLNGSPGGITISVSGSTGGESAIVVFNTSGLKMISVTVSDIQRNVETLEIPVLVRDDCTKVGIVDIQEISNPDFAGKTFFAQTPSMEVPITYNWIFGDGSTLTTDDPMGMHSYDNRVQNSNVDNFLITVTATNASESRRGQKSITMMNPHFVAAFYKGQYFLEGNANSFLKKTGSGFSANFRLSNPGNFSVNLTQVEETMHYCDTAVADSMYIKPAQNFLGVSSLANFDTYSGIIRLPSIPAGVCSIAYSILGNTATGNVPALSNLYFGTETDAFFTTAKPVSLGKKIKIKKALKALGYPAKITEGDILRLELEKKI